MHTFSKKHTDCAKGVACILLLLHHLFYNSPAYYEKFTPLLTLGGTPLACMLATLSKVCVAMFLILSGYGVAASLSKRSSDGNILSRSVRVSSRMIVKLLMSLWFVFLLFVPWQSFAGHWPYESLSHIPVDFLGLANIFSTSTMNDTWWYVSVALICYALTPLLNILVKKFPELSVAGTFCVLILLEGRLNASVWFERVFWICNYFIGLIAFEYGLFDRIAKFSDKNLVYRWFVSLALLGGAAWLRFNKGMIIDPLFAISLIVFAGVCLYSVPLITRLVQFIGRHSGNIFLMHTFVYLYNLGDVVYLPQYALPIYLLCMTICILISVAMEWLKKITRYNLAVKNLLNRISA